MIFLIFAFNLQMDKAQITAGDTLTLTYTFNKGKDYKLTPPNTDSLKWVRIFSAKSTGKKVILKITGFNAGKDTLLGLKFISADRKDTVKTDPVIFTVKSMLKGKNIKAADIYRPFSMFNPLWLLYLLIPILGYIGYLIVIKRKKGRLPAQKVELPPTPLSERIDTLWTKAENLLDKGYLKPFYITLSYILRLFLEEVYHFAALEQTTAELKYSLKKRKIKERDAFLEILNFADMVKFAKFIPDKESALIHLKKSKELTEVKNGTE